MAKIKWSKEDQKILSSLRSSVSEARARLKAMREEDALINSRLLISLPEDDLLREPTPEMRSAYVSHITDFSTTTLESFPISYLEPGLKSITISFIKRVLLRQRSTGKTAGRNLKTSATSLKKA